jgi:hypothetical protein
MYVADGIALRGDMVFTPDQPWKRAWLGLDGSVPRAVPMDALVSLVDEVLPGAVLQRLLLTAAFVLGGLGIARLAGRFHPFGQVAAVVVYLWNPWVHERLAIGQWVTVLAYGLLPWLVLAAARAREGRPAGWPATALLLVLTGVCAPSMGLLGTLVGLAVVATGKELRRIAGLLGLALLANLPWIVPAIVGPSLEATTSQFGDFAAHSESALGTFASLLSMGGIWKVSIVPPERTHVVVVGVAALMGAAFLLSFRNAVPVLGRRTSAGLVAAGGLSLLLALLPAIGPIGRSLGSLSAHWPALGVLRDSHRYLAPLGLLLAVGAAALVDRQLARARSGRAGAGAIAGLVVLAPVLLLPSLVWGLAGGLRPVSYPADWARVSGEVAGKDGATVVLPWTGGYRGYAWNHHRAVLDPAARYLPGDVLVDDRLILHDDVVQGEDPFLLRIGEALHGPDAAQALRELGVRWVLVEKGNGVRETDVPAGAAAFDGRWLRLVDLGAPINDLGPLRPAPREAMVVTGDIAAVLVGCVSVLQLGRCLVRTRQ